MYISTKLLTPQAVINPNLQRRMKSILKHINSTAQILQLQSHLIKTPFLTQQNPNLISHITFTYNTLIKIKSKSNSVESIKLYLSMLRIGLKPNKFTYPFVIKACGKCLMVQTGASVHSMAFKDGLVWDKHVGNTLVRMYAGIGNVGFARKVFDEMLVKDVVSWSSLISGYVCCNCSVGAIGVFREMRVAREVPNSVTLVSLLSACTRLLDIRGGKAVHLYAIVNQIGFDVALGTALLEMYSKCGQIEQAVLVFDLMTERNLQSWTVMISCLADHGMGAKAISLFNRMLNVGLKPDSMLFSVVLSACSHLGLVDEGKCYFDKMGGVYGINPTIEHYGCMVDLLGRAGLIDEAYEMIKGMPMEPNSVIVRSFFGACRNHDRIFCLDKTLLLKLEPDVGANYVLSANVSLLSGCSNDAANLWVAMKQKGMKKVPGCSWVEVNDCSDEENKLKFCTQ